MAILVVEQNATLALSIAQRGYLLESGVLAESRTASDHDERRQHSRCLSGVLTWIFFSIEYSTA